jgi:hypothetical protein
MTSRGQSFRQRPQASHFSVSIHILTSNPKSDFNGVFTAKAQRAQRILFFIKSGDADFMKSRPGRDLPPSAGLKVREAMRGYPLAASSPMDKYYPLRSLRLCGEQDFPEAKLVLCPLSFDLLPFPRLP